METIALRFDAYYKTIVWLAQSMIRPGLQPRLSQDKIKLIIDFQFNEIIIEFFSVIVVQLHYTFV